MVMRQFYVQFRSFRDIQDFVALASRQSLNLRVGTDRFQVNATSFMGMFALNCRKPQRVCVDCSEEEFRELLTTFAQFLAE
jgi:phosphotransferase system HPr-like phosphotransfer protein